MINISYLNADLPLKDNMHITALPLYQEAKIKWEQLHRIVKSDFRQYSPFSFENGIKKSENWNNYNQNILCLDVDDGLSIDEAKEMFKEYQYFLCTTKSHQQEKKGVKCDRFRIILKAKNVPTGDNYFIFTYELELLYPFIDKQVNTKTGAFLGYSDCQYWYNDGIEFDCSNLLEVGLFRKKLQEENKVIYPTRSFTYENNDLDIDKLRNYINRDVCAEIITSLGYEVDRNYKFKYRQDERTPSASINNSDYPLVTDFGGDLQGDIIYFVQEAKNCSFKEAVEYVKGFLNI